jgi:hypothetical protein
MSYPFRIERKSLIRANVGPDPDAPGAATQALADYMERLIKLIPAEVLSVYLTVRGFWSPTDLTEGTSRLDRSQMEGAGFIGWWPLICIVLLWISRAWGTRATPDWRTVQYVPILIATVSFIVWVLAMGHQIVGWHCDPRLASTAVVVWIFLLPVFYNGSQAGSGGIR